jgi:hypothetical protein
MGEQLLIEGLVRLLCVCDLDDVHDEAYGVGWQHGN